MAKKRPMQLNDLFAMKAPGRVAMSPDGRRIVYELKRFDLEENKNFTQLMLVEIETGATRALTAGQYNSLMPKWSPDGARLGFLSDREKPLGLYVLPMAGGDAVRIADRDGSVGDFSWSPDGKRLAYAYQPLNEREKLERDGKNDEIKKMPQYKHVKRLHHKLDGAGWWNGQYAHIYVAGADGGGKPKQLTFGDFNDAEPRFSPDGRLVSYVSNRVENPDLNFENTDIYVVKPSGGASKKLTRMPGYCGGHSWSPDGQTIAYLGNPAKHGESWKYCVHVWLVPATGGRPRELTPEIDNDCENLTLGDVAIGSFELLPPIWAADGSRVYFLVSEGGATRLYSRSIRGKDLRCEIGGDICIVSAQRTARDGPIAVSYGTQMNPADVFVFDPANDAPRERVRQLSNVNEDLFKRVEIVPPEPFSVKSGPATVHGWIVRPPGFQANRKYPAILEIHGGPHAQYGCSFFHELQWLAAKGYVVVFSNPRGSAGYGLKFRNCIHADWGNLDYNDVMKVTDWLFARPYVDKKRVGVTGGSYGGYMTNFLVGHTDRFRAAVTQRSVVNLESMFGTSDFGYDLGQEFGGLPWERLKEYRRQSPLSYVTKIKTPLLIEHEEEDHRCPIEQAEQLFASLKVLGREVELVRFEGESHGLSRGGRPQNRAERLKRIAGWFDKYMSK